MRIAYTTEAISDLNEIHDFIARDKPNAAQGVLARIQASIALLEDFPEAGRIGVVPGTRERVVRGLDYVVVYRIYEPASRLVVLNVIHGARRRLRDEG